jgi:S-adenosylmethionine-diacylglycerol 3-amino-3-carboxypropyl transferase
MLKFAVVREDATLEMELIRRFSCRRPLVVASGGCTALALVGCEVESVTAFDFNPAQLAHVREKERARARGDRAALGVDNEHGLHEAGAFEGLFRVLRRFVADFIDKTPEGLLHDPDRVRRAMTNPYWPAAFHTTFNEPFLHAMFGPAATQHAERGSYPGYFQRAFERGLLRDDAARNPFLHHVLSGKYRAGAVPEFVDVTPRASLDLLQGTLLDVPDLTRFDLFSLSNIFDWSDDALVTAWSQALDVAVPGSVLLLRQLNNRRDLRAFFPKFRFDDALGRSLYERDRSLFYERIEVGVRA